MRGLGCGGGRKWRGEVSGGRTHGLTGNLASVEASRERVRPVWGSSHRRFEVGGGGECGAWRGPSLRPCFWLSQQSPWGCTLESSVSQGSFLQISALGVGVAALQGIPGLQVRETQGPVPAVWTTCGCR